MSTRNMTRRSFIRRAAVSAAAIAGVSAASDYFGGGDYFPVEPVYPTDDVVISDDKIAVHPTGNGETDWGNLDWAVNNPDGLPVHLMPKAKDGERLDFMLPECTECAGYLGVEIRQDADIRGQAGGAAIQGGMSAFYSFANHNLSIRGITFKGQEYISLYGTFNNVDLVSSGTSPIPVPEPAFGAALLLNGHIRASGCHFNGYSAGMFCQAQGGKISSSAFASDSCGLYLGGMNTEASGNTFSGAGFADILVEGEQAQGNKLAGNKLSAASLANLIIWSNAVDTVVRLGIGSVASGTTPIPIPEPKVLDLGVGTDIHGSYGTITDSGPFIQPIADLSEEIMSVFAIE